MHTDDKESDNEEIGVDRDLLDNLTRLPLMDESFYLKIQLHNIVLVDVYLVQLERDLRDEFIERARNPVTSAAFLSALSQM